MKISKKIVLLEVSKKTGRRKFDILKKMNHADIAFIVGNVFQASWILWNKIIGTLNCV